MLEAVAVLDEVFGQPVQQSLVGGWVGDAKIVQRLDDAAPHVVFEHAVHNGAGEPGVLRGSDPPGKLFADILIEPLALGGPIEVLGIDVPLGLGAHHFAGRLESNFAFVVLISILDTHSPEESSEAPEVFLRPLLPGVVVAARTLDAHAQKYLADVGGDVLRF